MYIYWNHGPIYHIIFVHTSLKLNEKTKKCNGFTMIYILISLEPSGRRSRVGVKSLFDRKFVKGTWYFSEVIFDYSSSYYSIKENYFL